ncbi:hypothetical protein P168DRAFT_1277 [Aspergillus campestris IBT 28561]|uniref:Uncharacterized protein n=1 Tax=Aspergillus campestris (strain IBT 28561) TaxID=1392248 RepID=A0A2I1DCZ2_ASPC2|nr:uncharacterized protein P168DRAFT_1277 [Aspergillus campestris IBT 28561]PKY07730.1 hypothetical protein P168DRAFT_1277 [Aspergillus campestris IBT 28561]
MVSSLSPFLSLFFPFSSLYIFISLLFFSSFSPFDTPHCGWFLSVDSKQPTSRAYVTFAYPACTGQMLGLELLHLSFFLFLSFFNFCLFLLTIYDERAFFYTYLYPYIHISRLSLVFLKQKINLFLRI